MVKRISETPMVPDKPTKVKKTKKVENPKEGGKSPATLKLLEKSTKEAQIQEKKEKKELSIKQLETKQKNKLLREAKKEEKLKEQKKKEEEIIAKKAIQAAKRKEKRDKKKLEENEIQKPIDKSPSSTSITIKKEPTKKLEIPPPGTHVFDPELNNSPLPVNQKIVDEMVDEVQVPYQQSQKYKEASVSNLNVKRTGVWTVSGTKRRFH